MKKFLAALLAALVLAAAGTAAAAHEEVTGELVIYSSMYRFVLDMLDEAIREEFPAG